MRIARQKPINASANGPAGTYYHITNQVAGKARRACFGEPEKEKFLAQIKVLSRFYVIQPLFCTMMGNHYHLVVFVPAKAPSSETAIQRFQDYYNGEQALSASQARKLPERLRDISRFMHDLQHPFTCWYNRTRPERRRGMLWQGRFKSTILDPKTSLIPNAEPVAATKIRSVAKG